MLIFTVPILAGDATEQDQQCLFAGTEVDVLGQRLPIAHSAEKDDTGVRVEQHQQEHGGNDERGTDLNIFRAWNNEALYTLYLYTIFYL